jgi:hypothetical protein
MGPGVVQIIKPGSDNGFERVVVAVVERGKGVVFIGPGIIQGDSGVGSPYIGDESG